jgi:GNAT superfamily N-acetyltransferase
MEQQIIYGTTESEQEFSREQIVLFLSKHLEQYGDKEEDILAAIEYALSEEKGKGGFVLLGLENKEIVGTVVLNKTGMTGYIPENILVYIAVNSRFRGKGVGAQLMETVIKTCEGDIALHVEATNTARFLYEKMGFTNPYIEMRYKRKK